MLLVFFQPLQRRKYFFEPFPERFIERLTLDIFDEHVLGEFLDPLFHFGFDGKDEFVVREGRDDVEVVIGNQFSWTVLCGEKFLYGLELFFLLGLLYFLGFLLFYLFL